MSVNRKKSYEVQPRKSHKIIVIAGPTASGKSELAVKIALRLGSGQARKAFGINGAEIISADSRQIYKGLDIGTGKVEGQWRKNKITNQNSPPEADPPSAEKFQSQNGYYYKGIRHYCLDIVSPQKRFTVADFKKCADSAIRDITSQGKIPIICGGTGFYIDALIYDQKIPEVPPNWPLRKKLEKKTAEKLFQILKKLDPRRAENIDPHNPWRLIRAIEIIKSTKKPVPEFPRPGLFYVKAGPYNPLLISLKIPQEKLYQKIDARLEKRLKQGLVEEVQGLLKKGVTHKRLQDLGLEYRFVSLYLQKKLSKEEMINGLKNAIHHYAKRQMTWFRRNKKILWMTAGEKLEKKTFQQVRAFLKSNIKNEKLKMAYQNVKFKKSRFSFLNFRE